jgi:FkbM family methyltransferase
MNILKPYVKKILTNRRVLGNSYDYLFRNASGSLTVQVPAFSGRFEIDIRSHILRRILVNGEYESTVAAFVAAHVDPRRDAIDAGANIGLFTIGMLAAGARRVLAVEPMPLAQHYLRQNVLNNGRSDQVVLHAGAVAAECGTILMNYIPGKEEYSSIDILAHPAIRGLQSQSILVPVKTLDLLVEENGLDPAIIKIDTEGSEHRVLAGAQSVLQKFRPLLVLERGDATEPEVSRILAECNYRLIPFDASTNIAMPGQASSRV